MNFKGTPHDDHLVGTTGTDSFRLLAGGEDYAFGDAGNDLFLLGGALSDGDQILGGAGRDTLSLKGDYAAGFTFGANALSGVEVMRLLGAFDYQLTTNNTNVAAGGVLQINGRGITGGHGFIFNGIAEDDGRFAFLGSAGNDVLTGGARNDKFNLTNGGEDTVNGGGGSDTFTLGGALTAQDHINGGKGSDTLVLGTGYGDFLHAPFVFGPTTFTGIEKLVIAPGTNHFATVDANVAAGATLTVDAGTSQLRFDGSAETDGNFHFIADRAPGSAEYLVGGAGDDTIDLGAGLNHNTTFLFGGAGNDTLNLDGDYSKAGLASAAIMDGIENVHLAGGHTYRIQIDATGETSTTVDGSELGVGDSLDLVGAHSTVPYFAIGGAGFDQFELHSTQNTITPGGGPDSVNCGFGTTNTIIIANAADTADASGRFHDSVYYFNFDTGKFDLTTDQPLTSVQTMSGAISTNTFGQDMDAIFDTHLTNGVVWLVTATGGTLNGDTFIVVGGGAETYDASHDYVIQISNYSGTIDAGDFI